MKRTQLLLLLVASLGFTPGAAGHEVRPAYLEVRQTGPETYDILWKVPAVGADRRLGIYLRFPRDTTELGEPRAFFSEGAYVERRHVQIDGGLDGRTIHIDGLAATTVEVLARIERLDGATQTERVLPANPELVVQETPTAWNVSATYTALGVEHILGGVDHLLFVLALVILVTNTRRLIATITAFTVAHSMTLAGATLGFVHVPGPPVEACIALSIVFVAAEIVHGRRGSPGLTERAPWLIAFTFGLLHGLGFAGALSAVGLPEQAIPLALFFFNVGVEIGQLTFIAVVLGFAAMARRVPTRPRRWAWRVLPYAIGTIAMFSVIQRASTF